MRASLLRFMLVLCVLSGAEGIAHAQSAPPIVNRPAATLLLPYFEVDLEAGYGTTLFSVNNASASAVLTRVTIWSDLGIPVFALHVYLTGFDAVTFDLLRILVGDVSVPYTATAGQDPFDVISPQGDISQDINYATCSGVLGTLGPRNGEVPLDHIYSSYLREVLTGQPSSFHQGRCLGRSLGGNIARGYVTVDVVTQCSGLFPSDPGYFSGVAEFRNILWGDYQYINRQTEEAFGDSLVSIYAESPFGGTPNPELTTPGQYTFYGRFNGWSAADGREPLATSFAARFVSPKDFKTVAKARRRTTMPAGTDLIVWRDPKVATAAPFTCAQSAPSWYPLGQEGVRAFDEQENTELVSFPAQLFPAATQRVPVASTSLPTTFASGWMYLNLNHAASAAGANPPEDPLAAQAWVTVLQRVRQGPNGGRYEVGYRAVRLDSAQNASHVIP